MFPVYIGLCLTMFEYMTVILSNTSFHDVIQKGAGTASGYTFPRWLPEMVSQDHYPKKLREMTA